MACTAITKGRGLDCNRISGGVKYIYFSVYDDNITYAYDGTNPLEIDTIDFNNTNIYRYTMPLGVSSVTDTIVGSRENGTYYQTPSVNIILNKLTKEDQNQIKLLAQSRVRIFAQLNEQLTGGNDVIIALGMSNGLELNAGTMDSGASFGDRSGYSLTFEGMEPIPFAMLENYGTEPFDNAGFTQLTSIVTTA